MLNYMAKFKDILVWREFDSAEHNARNKVHTIASLNYLAAGVVLIGSVLGSIGTSLTNPYRNNSSVNEHSITSEKLQNLRAYQCQVPSFHFAPELKPQVDQLRKSIDDLVNESQVKLAHLENESDYLQYKEWLDTYGILLFVECLVLVR